MLRLPIIFILVIFFGCSNSSDEQVRKAIDIAQTHLSFDRCEEALTVLQEVGPKPRNAIYLQVLASAYACRAGYSEINFLLNDLDDIQTNNFNEIFQSLSVLSLSSEIEADSANYVHLRNAISYLRVPAADPTHNGRVAAFGNRKAGDLSVQQLLLSIAQLGKFLNYYGSVNAAGEKGQRSPNNKCFFTYDDPPILAVLATYPSSVTCSGTPVGHPDLALNLTSTRRRLCEGFVLLTNIIDILESIPFSTIDPLQSLGTIGNVIDVFKQQITTSYPSLSPLFDITTQAACEAHAVNNFVDIQRFYAAVFEVGLE
jgi:hypothetical protein